MAAPSAPPTSTRGTDEAAIKINRQITELRVLESELSSLKKNARVYKQQANSNVYFLTDKGHCQYDCKKMKD